MHRRKRDKSGQGDVRRGLKESRLEPLNGLGNRFEKRFMSRELLLTLLHIKGEKGRKREEPRNIKK